MKNISRIAFSLAGVLLLAALALLASFSAFRQLEQITAERQQNYQVIPAAILGALLLGLLAVYFVHLETRKRFKNLALQKTQESLQMQEELSQRLLQSTASLQISQEKMRVFSDNVPSMTASFDENLYCSYASTRYAEYFGFAVTDILGKHLREIIGPDAYSEVEGYFAQALRGHPVNYQRTRKSATGEASYLEVKVLPRGAEGESATGCFVVTTDITEHKLVAERIQCIAHHDSLTGLPNRLLFSDRLNHAMSQAKRDACQFALMYLDLDKFKPVNDSFGHAIGDELLQGVASRIRTEVRESDTVARVGGDEFVVILPNIASRKVAETVAQKIITAIAMPFQLGSQKEPVEIGVSIGIAIYPADANDADALIKAADRAMYKAKQVGGSFS